MTVRRGEPSTAQGTTRLFETMLRPLQAFFRLEAASGLVLIGCAVAALAWANLANDSYRFVFDSLIVVGIRGSAARFTLAELVNDGLMSLFFFVVGMEIKRELTTGELRTVPQAILPAIAALGGMVVPAGIYLAFNARGPGAPGWGIPMATDIAFCIGVLTLLKRRVPHALIVFVTALAIFDDIGGILVIALFYGTGLHVSWLLAAAAVTAASFAMSRAYVRNPRLDLRRSAAVVHAPPRGHPRDHRRRRPRSRDPGAAATAPAGGDPRALLARRRARKGLRRRGA